MQHSVCPRINFHIGIGMEVGAYTWNLLYLLYNLDIQIHIYTIYTETKVCSFYKHMWDNVAAIHIFYHQSSFSKNRTWKFEDSPCRFNYNNVQATNLWLGTSTIFIFLMKFCWGKLHWIPICTQKIPKCSLPIVFFHSWYWYNIFKKNKAKNTQKYCVRIKFLLRSCHIVISYSPSDLRYTCTYKYLIHTENKF